MPSRMLQILGFISGSKCALNGEDYKGYLFLLWGVGGAGRRRKNSYLENVHYAPVRHCWVKHLVYQRFRGPKGEASAGTLFKDRNISLWGEVFH